MVQPFEGIGLIDSVLRMVGLQANGLVYFRGCRTKVPEPCEGHGGIVVKPCVAEALLFGCVKPGRCFLELSIQKQLLSWKQEIRIGVLTRSCQPIQTESQRQK